MVRRLLPLLSLAAALGATLPAAADTLLVEGLNQASASAGQRPSRGMTMDKVANQWGEPRARQAAIGDPPITRWDYDGFSVFFEYSHVIHAVRHN